MRSIVLLVLLVAGGAFLFASRTAVIRSRGKEPRTARIATASRSPATAAAANLTLEAEDDGVSLAGNGTEITMTVRGPGLNEKEARATAFANAAEWLIRKYDLRQEIAAKDLEATRIGKGEPVPADPERPGDGVIVKETFRLDTAFLEKLAVQERQYRTEERMAWLLRGLAVAVAGLFAISGYLRLDEWSKGYLSGVLKFAAVAAVLGVVIAVFRWR